MFNVKGDTVFADITRFLEVCGMSAPGTVHAVWNDETVSSGTTPPGMNSIGAGDTAGAKNLRDLELKLKQLNDAIEAVRKSGGDAEAKGFEAQIDTLIQQVGDRFDSITGSANETIRKFQEDASAPLDDTDPAAEAEGGEGAEGPGGIEQAGFDMSGAGNEDGGDFGDFAALSSAQEEGDTSPSGSTAPEEPKQKG